MKTGNNYLCYSILGFDCCCKKNEPRDNSVAINIHVALLVSQENFRHLHKPCLINEVIL